MHTTTPIVAVFAPLPESSTVGPLTRCMLHFHVMPEFAPAVMQMASDAAETFVAFSRDVESDGTAQTNEDGSVTVFHYDTLSSADARNILRAIQPLVALSDANTLVYRKFGIRLKPEQQQGAILSAAGG